MKGSIIKRGQKYAVVVDIGRDENGKRKQKWFHGFDKKKDAQTYLNKILNQIETNTFIVPDKLTVSEFIQEWFREIVQPNLKDTTIDGYRYFIDGHIIPGIGAINLQKLQPINIQQFYTKELESGRLDGKGGLSPKSVLNIHRILKKSLNYALKVQMISRNVAEFVEVPKQKKYNAAFLNEQQVKEMLEALKDSNAYIPALLGVSLGLRRGEVFGLRWMDINFNNSTISIKQTLVNTRNGLQFQSPKSETSNRVIIAPQKVVEELKLYKEKQNTIKDIMGEAYEDNDLVNCYGNGKAINPSTFSKTFYDELQKRKLPHIRFHDLRHTNATIMLKHNIPAKVASERLGHSTIGITLDLYSHVLKEMQQEAANKINDALFPEL